MAPMLYPLLRVIAPFWAHYYHFFYFFGGCIVYHLRTLNFATSNMLSAGFLVFRLLFCRLQLLLEVNRPSRRLFLLEKSLVDRHLLMVLFVLVLSFS